MSQQDFLRHFEACTVAVLRNSQVVGTGFFAAPGLVVTCAHVVEGLGDSLGIRWKNNKITASVEKIGNPKSMLDVEVGESTDPDLAMLRVSNGLVGDASRPCVFFDETIPGLADPLYSFGHAEGEYSENGEALQLAYEGPAYDRVGRALLKLREGNVRPGMSGAPLLSRKSGKVCGVLFASRDVRTDLGGRAFPTQLVFPMFPNLKSSSESFQLSDSRWIDLWSEREGAVLLFDFPRGPVVEPDKVGMPLIRAVAKLYPPPVKAQAIVREANRLRLQADVNGGLIDSADIPPPTAKPIDYWFGVFENACLQGPRMLAALLLVMDDWQFTEALQRERREILDYLRRL